MEKISKEDIANEFESIINIRFGGSGYFYSSDVKESDNLYYVSIKKYVLTFFEERFKDIKFNNEWKIKVIEFINFELNLIINNKFKIDIVENDYINDIYLIKFKDIEIKDLK